MVDPCRSARIQRNSSSYILPLCSVSSLPLSNPEVPPTHSPRDWLLYSLGDWFTRSHLSTRLTPYLQRPPSLRKVELASKYKQHQGNAQQETGDETTQFGLVLDYGQKRALSSVTLAVGFPEPPCCSFAGLCACLL